MSTTIETLKSLHAENIHEAELAAASPQARYARAILALDKVGVMVLENYPACCGSCASAEMASLGLDESTKTAWFISEQGHNIFWRDGQPWESEEWSDAPTEERPKKVVYWNHSGHGVGDLIAQAFRDQGFEVDFDGDPNRCPVLKF